MKCAIHLKT